MGWWPILDDNRLIGHKSWIIIITVVVIVLGKAKLGSQSWDDRELGSELRPFSPSNDLTTNVKYGMSKMEEVVLEYFSLRQTLNTTRRH